MSSKIVIDNSEIAFSQNIEATKSNSGCFKKNSDSSLMKSILILIK